MSEITYSAETVAQYQQFRSDLANSVVRQQQAYDQAVLKFAVGGLGLTVTLGTALVSAHKNIGSHLWLVLAWVCLAGSIAAVLFSFVTSQVESLARIEFIDEKNYEKAKAPRSTKMTKALNYTSGTLLVLGGICLALFVTLNL